MEKHRIIRRLLDAIVSWFFIFFHPSYWLMNKPYSREWDHELVRMMKNFKFTEIGAFDATLGDKKIWIANHPYASFTFSQNTNPFEHTVFRPSRWTIYLAQKKLRCDFNNNTNNVELTGGG